jgi:hypothetical protein
MVLMFPVLTLVFLALQTPAATGPAAGAGSPCVMPDADVRWVQRALDGWEQVRREYLKLDESPLPWIVLFDASCTWHLAPEVRLLPPATTVATPLMHDGRPVDVRAQSHQGTVLLPNRVEVAAAVKASTALYRNGRAPFFSMSLPSVWRQDPSHAKAPQLDEFLQGVMVHELTHTRLLVAVNRRLRDLIQNTELSGGLNDDVIQREFGRVTGFERAFQRERDLFYQAVHETDAARRTTLAHRALTHVKERHARYFTGSKAVYREIEALFLTLEGTGQWAAFRLATARARPGALDAASLKLVRDNRKYWSQDEGLALFLLIDALVPGWQSRVFSSTPPSPFDLLEEVILQQTSGARR